MKLNLTVFIAFLGMVLTGQQLYAQFNMTEAEKEEALEAYLEFQDELDLSEDQKVRVEEINTDYFEGLSLLKNSGQSKLEKYKTFKKLSAARDSEMKKVLDQRQFGLYKEFQKGNRERIKAQRKNRG